MGASRAAHEVIRPVQLHEHLRDHARLFDRLAELRREGYTAGEIAARLNEEGFRAPKAPGATRRCR